MNAQVNAHVNGPAFPADASAHGTVDRPRERVAAYVVRPGRHGAEVLVFEHVGAPEAGLQVPAGGVRGGETREQAVLREVAEETGIVDARVIQQVAVEDKPHPETGRPRRTAYFHLEVPADTPEVWTHRVRAGDASGSGAERGDEGAAEGDDGSRGKGEDADEGMLFACSFAPLPLRQPLADDQDAWLGHIDPRWTTVIDIR